MMKFFILLITLTIVFVAGTFVHAQNLYISGGNAFTAMVCADGTVYTMGYNSSGQLGRTTVQNKDVNPGKVSGLPPIQVVDAGSSSTALALDCNGEVWTWGNNAYGQLGDGQPVNANNFSSTPVHVVGIGGVGYLSNVLNISAGGNMGYAVVGDNHQLVAWGGDESGELGDGHIGGAYNKSIPQYIRFSNGTILDSVVGIDAGNAYCVVLRADGSAWVFGENGHNQCGPGGNQAYPVRIFKDDGTSLTNVKMVSAGDSHVMLEDSNGNLWTMGGTWGNDQLGTNGQYNGTPTIHEVLAGEQQSFTGSKYLAGVKYISGGGASSWAIVDWKGNGDGYMMAWGASTYGGGSVAGGSEGLLGRGLNYTDIKGNAGSGVPVFSFYQDGSTIDTLKHVIAIGREDGTVFAETMDPVTKQLQLWGSGGNQKGQLGLGDSTDRGYFIKLNVPCEMAEPCPEADFGVNALTVCPRDSFTLYAGSTGTFFHYIWWKDGSVLGNASLIRSGRASCRERVYVLV